MRVIGLCRFSYVGYGGYKNDHEDLETRRAYLYAPDRLEERFRLFETICLPSVIGQTDKDFSLAIVTGECLPEQYLERLLALTAPLPNVAVLMKPPGRHRSVMSRALNFMREDYGQPCIQFRLDDDDAMAVDFIARIKQAAENTRAIWQNAPMMTIDYNRGFVYEATADGLAISPDRHQYSALALGVVIPAGSSATIMKYGHHMLWKETLTLTFPDQDMFLRGYNGFNDSRSKGGGRQKSFAPITAEQAAHIRNRFNVENAQVARAFSNSTLLPLPVECEETGQDDQGRTQ